MPQAHLLLAKWLDVSGHTQAAKVTAKYQYAPKHYARFVCVTIILCSSLTCTRWEKGHYYLGKHYNKLLEAEKVLPVGKQSDAL